MSTPSASQFRAARALLDWSMAQAAREAKVSVSTMMVAEGKSPGRKLDGAGPVLRAAFEAAGVVFIDGEQESGVKLRRAGVEPP